MTGGTNVFFPVNYWVLLEMNLFIPPNIFLGVIKHHVLGGKLLGTFGDALSEHFLTE